MIYLWTTVPQGRALAAMIRTRRRVWWVLFVGAIAEAAVFVQCGLPTGSHRGTCSHSMMRGGSGA